LGLRLRGTSPPRAACGARLSDDAVAYHGIPPGAWAAPALSRPAPLIRGAGGVCVWQTRKPLGLDPRDVVCHRLGFLLLGHGRRLGLLGRQWTRMHHDKAHLRLRALSGTVLDFDRAYPALATPGARRFVLGAPRFLHYKRQRGLLLSPRFQCLSDGTRARDSRDEATPALQAHPQRAATLGLTIRDDPADPVQAQGPTLLNREWGCHTSAAIAIPHPEPQRDAAIATHAETEQHLFEIGPPIFAMPVGGPRCPWYCGFLCIRPLERHGRGVLMEPGRWQSIDRQRLEGHRTQHRIEVGSK